MIKERNEPEKETDSKEEQGTERNRRLLKRRQGVKSESEARDTERKGKRNVQESELSPENRVEEKRQRNAKRSEETRAKYRADVEKLDKHIIKDIIGGEVQEEAKVEEIESNKAEKEEKETMGEMKDLIKLMETMKEETRKEREEAKREREEMRKREIGEI